MTATRRKLFTLPFTLALLLAASAARADEPVDADAPQQQPGYRMQMLALDGAAVGLFVTGDAIEGTQGLGNDAAGVFMAVGAAGAFLNGPVLHVVHGNYARAVGSLGMRVALPLVGAVVGASMATCQPDAFLCGLSEMGAGMMVGSVTAMVLDAGLLAGPSEHAAAPPPPAPRGLALTPRIAASQNLAFVGLGGQF